MTLRDRAIAAHYAEVQAAKEQARNKEREEQERKHRKWMTLVEKVLDQEGTKWVDESEVALDFDRQCIWIDDIPFMPIDLRNAGPSLVLLDTCRNCGQPFHAGEVYHPIESLANLGAQLSRRGNHQYCQACKHIER